MKKASSSFLVFVFAVLLVSFQSFAQVPSGRGQQNEVIRETINQNIRSYENLNLSELLRLSRQEQHRIELLSLSIRAQSLIQGPAQIELSLNGRPLATETVRRQLKEIRFVLPAGAMADGLALSSSSEIYLESITAEISRIRIPSPEPRPEREQQAFPNSLITLSVHQSIRGHGIIQLDQLARQQMGITLEGAQIERIVVQGRPSMYGRSASVQAELNRRPVGQIKYLSTSQGQLPLQVQSMEEVRSLALIVNGDADIYEIRIRVGQVRTRHPELPRIQRVLLSQEVSHRMPLELSRVLGYEQRLIRAISIEARTIRQMQSQLNLIGNYGELHGSVIVGQNLRATLQLRRPMSAQELRFEAMAPVIIEALEIEFEQAPRY